jgi:hypothetical protein
MKIILKTMMSDKVMFNLLYSIIAILGTQKKWKVWKDEYSPND